MDKIKDLEHDLENREKIKALFESRNEIPDDDAIVKEFTYANEEVGDDKDVIIDFCFASCWQTFSGILIFFSFFFCYSSLRPLSLAGAAPPLGWVHCARLVMGGWWGCWGWGLGGVGLGCSF